MKKALFILLALCLVLGGSLAEARKKKEPLSNIDITLPAYPFKPQPKWNVYMQGGRPYMDIPTEDFEILKQFLFTVANNFQLYPIEATDLKLVFESKEEMMPFLQMVGAGMAHGGTANTNGRHKNRLTFFFVPKGDNTIQVLGREEHILYPGTSMQVTEERNHGESGRNLFDSLASILVMRIPPEPAIIDAPAVQSPGPVINP